MRWSQYGMYCVSIIDQGSPILTRILFHIPISTTSRYSMETHVSRYCIEDRVLTCLLIYLCWGQVFYSLGDTAQFGFSSPPPLQCWDCNKFEVPPPALKGARSELCASDSREENQMASPADNQKTRKYFWLILTRVVRSWTYCSHDGSNCHAAFVLSDSEILLCAMAD